MSYPSSKSGTSRAEVRRPKRPSIREEARGAILIEQLSYLLDHVASCAADCPDCTRLRSVERILLQPFDVGGLCAPGTGVDSPNLIAAQSDVT